MRAITGLLAGAALFAATVSGLQARQGATAGCRVSGRVSGAGTALPGVAVTARAGDGAPVVTSTGIDGTFTLTLPFGAYHLTFELTGFDRTQRDVTVSSTTCAQTADATLALTPRAARQSAPAQGPVAGRTGGGGRFQTLTLERGAAQADVPATEEADNAPALLLPPGFANEAGADAIAVNGADARVDRGQLNDRQAALGRGDFPFAGDLPPGAFGIAQGGGAGGPGGPAGQAGAGGPGGPGGFRGGGGGGGGRGGRGGFFLGGRGGQQRRVTGTFDYNFGGSVLNAAPYQLRPDVPTNVTPYTQNSFGTTIGGPVKLGHLYDGTQKTNFTFTYNGNRGATVFDQYATVPTAAMRAGDLSSLAGPIINPATGQPFPNNQIPASMISPQARTLLNLYPLPNLSGATQNYHLNTTTGSTSDAVNLRVTHNFTPNVPGGFGRGGFGRGGGNGGRGGRGNQATSRGTSVALTAQFQYRRNKGDQTNVFSSLGGTNESATLAAPVSLNIIKGRSLSAINVQFSRTTSSTTNHYSGNENIAGNAGILGTSPDPFAWGVPTLSFSSITGLRDITPALRDDRRFTMGYTWTHPVARHVFRIGGNLQLDRSNSHTETNAAGTFVFTGLYSSGGRIFTGSDFADFLLGQAQQASVQYGPGDVTLLGKSTSAFVQDDWRIKSNLTLNLGVRYELLWPFVESNNHLVNLDVAPGFTAATPVAAGGTGPFSGTFPDALLKTDTNNVAPRLGFAWRAKGGVVVRGGYGVSYNSGQYAAIARQLATQPPFAVANTQLGTINSALLLENALTGTSGDVTTNTYGVDDNYSLGTVQSWNIDFQKQFRQVWLAGAGYTYTRGSNLDIVRAPNRGPDGLRIPDVQPFLWQTAEGESRLHSATFRLQRRQVRGLGFGVTYTLARSRDNSPSIGGGGGSGVVAQNDQDLNAEWGLSNFDRRHRVTTTLQYELPFGPNKRWLSNGGTWAGLVGSWRVAANLEVDSGTPLTPRLLSSARDAAQGINGALRADYNGAPIEIASPGVDRFFNTSAFSIPTTGFFGDAARNIITGPGSRELDAQLSRDVALGGNRALTIQVRATNLLNNVNFLAIDTYVNSPTFGEVLSVKPMRTAQLNLRFRF